VVLLWIGAIVAVGFWAFFPDRSEPVDIVGIEGHSDSTELILQVQHGSCEADGPDVDVEEDEVTVGLSARYDASGDCDDVLVESTVTITLDEPLGSRRIESRAANDGGALVCLIDDVPSTQCTQT
jgi:hypothetical protein